MSARETLSGGSGRLAGRPGAALARQGNQRLAHESAEG